MYLKELLNSFILLPYIRYLTYYCIKFQKPPACYYAYYYVDDRFLYLDDHEYLVLHLALCNLNTLVPLCAQYVDDQIRYRQSSKQEVEPIQMTKVEVPRDPSWTPLPSRELHNNSNQHDTDIVPKRDWSHTKWTPKAFNPIRCLPIEKLQLANVHEYFGCSNQCVLWNLP